MLTCHRICMIFNQHAIKLIGALTKYFLFLFCKTFITLTLFFTLLGAAAFAQSKFTGTVTDSLTHIPVRGVTVMINPGSNVAITDETGHFSLKSFAGSEVAISFSAVGYGMLSLPVTQFKSGQTVCLAGRNTQLSDVVISASNMNPYRAISETDVKLRGVSNSQEVLRIVPGLFIGQHQGGGKAEQIFLRGFDNDHGTDINMSVDGMPINMVSHAHGQGYADSHFIIPETIENTTYEKGMFNATKGDLAVTGFVNFHTANAIPQNMIRAEAGQYSTYRLLAMFNLLGDRAKAKGQSWYAASEYRYSNSYFDNPQHFQRFNFFTKYTGSLGAGSRLSLSASTLYSKWKASGQIPESSVEQGMVGFYGAIDPNEGGITSRTNVNVQVLTSLSNHNLLRNEIYYSRYKFDLHSNFTFFLNDPVNGDEIRQQEARNLVGYNASYINDSYLGKMKLISEAGLNFRLDATRGSSLFHMVNNYIVLDSLKYGDITETTAGVYLSEILQLSIRFSVNAGLRFDQFYYQYSNKLASDSTLSGVGIYRANNNIISPKLKLNYQLDDKAQLYWFLGKGFHSNDTRVVVAQNGLQTLPAAYGTDLGAVLKPASNLLINAAVWYSYLQKEYVYAGDGGSVEFSGRTRRIGFDLSGRYQPVKAIYFDADLNYAHGRSLDEAKGANYIPLAPVWSSTGGMTYMLKGGFNGSLRYRWLGTRPANENYSLKAEGYFINDLVLNYTKKKYEVGLTINNLFNVKWKETQFETETRLKGQQAVNDIAFTAGTKFFAIAHICYFFK